MLCSVDLLTSSYKCLHCRCLDLLCRNKISFLNIGSMQINHGYLGNPIVFFRQDAGSTGVSSPAPPLSWGPLDISSGPRSVYNWTYPHYMQEKKKNRWPQEMSRYLHTIFSGDSSKIMTLNMCPGKGVLLPHQASQRLPCSLSPTLRYCGYHIT